MKVSSLEAMQFPFLRFHIYQATFEFKFNFSVFPDLDKKALRNKKPKHKQPACFKAQFLWKTIKFFLFY